MIELTLTPTSTGRVADVFDHVTDPAGSPPGRPTPSRRWPTARCGRARACTRCTARRAASELESVVEVAEFEPGRVFALRVVEGTPVHLRITFEPADGGTRLRFRAYGQLGGGMRLIQPVIGRALKRQFTEQLATLERVLEPATVQA